MRTRDENGYCGLVAEVLTSYLDHSLSASLERDVAAHLEECPACRRRLKGMTALIADLKKLDQADVPEEISWSIKRAVHREARKDSVLSILKPLPFLTSAAAAAIILVVTGLTGGKEVPAAGGDHQFYESLSVAEQTRLQRYILPPQIGDLEGTGLFENQLAEADTARSETPVRLPGARAVSF
jgi:anti-sigma factor RsiW